MRFEAAKAAAPFCHARLQATTMVGPPNDEVVEVTLIADGTRTILRDGEVVRVERDLEPGYSRN
jgi:hypothetical protein